MPLPVAAGLVHEPELRSRILAERRSALEARRLAAGATAAHVVEGRVPEALVELAAEVRPEVIVVGRHGQEEAYLIGHVAERLVRAASLPVISVPPGASTEGAALRSVLCPIDLSSGADRAFAEALETAIGLGAAVHVLHVIDLPTYVTRQPELTTELERMVTLEVRGLVARHRERGARITEVVRQGAAADVILQVARELTVDAILVPSHARGPVARFFLGSVAERLVRSADRPVWTFRPGGQT